MSAVESYSKTWLSHLTTSRESTAKQVISEAAGKTFHCERILRLAKTQLEKKTFILVISVINVLVLW